MIFLKYHIYNYWMGAANGLKGFKCEKQYFHFSNVSYLCLQNASYNILQNIYYIPIHITEAVEKQ